MKIKRLSWAWLFVFLISGNWIPPATASAFFVTTTSDMGLGSLRQAIDDVNTHVGADTIAFSIPTSDPGYDAVTGVWTIRPATALPSLMDNATAIDGTTQSANQGDTNPLGPEIEIDGTNAGNCSGFSVLSANNLFKGLVINRFAWIAIDMSGTPARGNIIRGNYIGTNATGMIAQGNALGGIWIRFGSRDNRIGEPTVAGRNLICGTTTSVNLATGNGVYIEKADSNRIVGNYIGVNREGTATLPNTSVGVCLKECRYTVVGGTAPGEGNVISGNGWVGVVIRMLTGGNNVVSGNYIGTDSTGRLNLGNAFNGVLLDFGSQSNTIGPGNVIAFNGSHGVTVTHDSTYSNTITQNAITKNAGQGIINTLGGNRELAPPTITSVSSTSISGTAVPNSRVEIFSDSTDEGALYEGTVVADGSGHFTWNGGAAGPYVTATCTDTLGSTSEFSSPVVTGAEERLEFPRKFALDQNFPNPFNLGTRIKYRTSRIEDVRLVVYDLLGREVAVLVDEVKGPGSYSVNFDAGRLASGVYLCQMTSGTFKDVKKLILLR